MPTHTTVATLIFGILFLAISSPAFAQFKSENFRQALKLKKEFYLKDGTFTGGDRNSADFRVKDIRIAQSPAGYDRVVLELSGNAKGEKISLSRPPFYLIELNSTARLITITLYGKPKLEFSIPNALQATRKSKTITKVNFIPLVNEDRWIWTIETQVPVKTEVFELSDPARIILDLKK